MIGMEGKIKEVGDEDGSMVGKVDSRKLNWGMWQKLFLLQGTTWQSRDL